MEKVIAAYLVLDRWAAERGWVGVSIKCPTGVAAHMGFTPVHGGLPARAKVSLRLRERHPRLADPSHLGFAQRFDEHLLGTVRNSHRRDSNGLLRFLPRVVAWTNR